MHPLDVHWIYTFGSVALVAGASLTGMLALAFDSDRLSGIIPFFVSLAAGALLGTAFGHLLPEAVEQVGAGRKLWALLLGSFVTFFVLEKILGIWCEQYRRIHLHGAVPSDNVLTPHSDKHRPMITNLLVGAGIHSFIDGLAIATAYITGTNLGIITTIAVLFHEAPHHIGDVSILIHKDIPVMRAVYLGLVAASPSALGALLVLLLGTRLESITTVLLPFTAANFLYIAAASLMPELQQERGLRQSLGQTGLLLAASLMMFAFAEASETTKFISLAYQRLFALTR
jgi:zinc and cadmium transporter